MGNNTMDTDSDSEMVGQSGGWAQGISKGVFSHKRKRSKSSSKVKGQSPGKRSKKRQRGSNVRDPEDDLCDYYMTQCLGSRSSLRVDLRVESHNQILSTVQSTANQLRKEVFTGVFDGIVEFVSDSCKNDSDTIPTAVLLTGVNMPDHLAVFNLLIQRLGSVSQHLALVGPGLTLKSLVSHVVVELTSPDKEKEPGVKKSEASFSQLNTWYSNQYSGGDEKPPLIIILQDFEGSAGPALQDLITLMTRYSNLPFILVFGVATTLDTVHKTLPLSATSKLTIHPFGSPPATMHLDQVVDKVLMNSDTPFLLDYRVFKFLVENFLYHDFSVHHFMEGFKFILGEHFYRIPATVLCCNLSDSLARLDDLNNEELDSVRRLSSFRSYLEQKLEIDKQAEILVNEISCKKLVRQLLTEQMEQHVIFTMLTRCLFHLTHDLPRRPLGKMVRVTYELSLTPGLQTGSQWKEAWRYLQLSSRPDLEIKINKVLTELKTIPQLSKYTDQISTLLTKLTTMGTETPSLVNSPIVPRDAPSPFIIHSTLPSSSDATPISSTLNTPSGSSQNTPSISSNLPPKLDRFNLKKSLLALKEKSKTQQPQRPFDLLRTELLTCLQSLFSDHLIPPISLPLHEIFVFSSLGAVKRHLVGAPRAALHTALTQPGEYLDHPDIDIKDPGEIPSTLPDICIGYKLHLECPRLINVFDWLTCWNTIVTGSEEDTAPDPTQQARFSRIVAEIQMLGFIKTSSKKTDHVSRLTFGGS